jgi:hypothetical protein
VGEDRRNELADYLLGQQTASRRAATREYLEDSKAGRGWARAVAAALRPLAGDDGLPEIPSETAEVHEAFDALRKRNARQEQVQASSQLGTKLLFVAGGLVVAIVLILALGIFSGDDDPDKATTSTVVRTTPVETPNAVAEGTMKPPAGTGSSASAQMGIIQYPVTNRFKLLIAAKGLAQPPKGAAYGVWLYTSKDDATFVGFPKGEIDSKGELQVVADLSPETRTYREVLITRERTESPKTPGEIVMRGVLRIAKAPSTTTTPQTTTTPPPTQTTP